MWSGLSGKIVETVASQADIDNLKFNKIIGSLKLINSRIVFKGTGNILRCDPEGVVLENSSVSFQNDNGLAVLSHSKHRLRIRLSVHRSASFYIGENAFIAKNPPLIVASEGKPVFIGKDVLFSHSICIRTSDAHPIYSAATMERINGAKGVFVGDHVWIGQDVLLLKGTRIGSGSIIAASSVVAGKLVPSNTSWGGVPSRQIASDVFFSKRSLHDSDDPSEHFRFPNDTFVYKPKEGNAFLGLLEDALSSRLPAEERLEKLSLFLGGNAGKNRFALSSLPSDLNGSAAKTPQVDAIATKHAARFSAIKKRFRRFLR